MNEQEFVDQAIAEFESDASDLAYQYEAGKLSKSDWEEEMAALVVSIYLLMWLFGKGGDGALSSEEKATVMALLSNGALTASEQQQLDDLLTLWGGSLTAEERAQLEAMLGSQLDYLSNFAKVLDTLVISDIIRRAMMYINSARQAYEKAKVYGYADLPAYPCDGTSECLSNCRCHWEIQVSNGRMVAYWRLGAADHCMTCQTRSQEWNPYIVPIVEVN